MIFYKNKKLYDSDGQPLYTVDDEIILTNDLVESVFPNEYVDAIKSPIITPIFKLYLLYNDESIKEDITEYVIEGGNLSIEYQQGQRRTASITLLNSDGRWSKLKNDGGIWAGVKFRIDLGLYVNQKIYLKSQGIFTPKSNDTKDDADLSTVGLQLVDKFSLLDGTLGGKFSENYTIPVGEKVRDAIESLLLHGKEVNNYYDLKPIIFPKRYETENLAYTITKEAGSNCGELLKELASMINCDIYYNENGNLVLESGTDNLSPINKPLLWTYDKNELELLSSGTSRDYGEIINKAIVVGANLNGKIFSAYSENRNLNSPSNVINNPINFIRITDENIYSDELAQDRADYELYKASVESFKLSMSSTYIPHLDVNKCIAHKYGLDYEKFLIKSVNINFGGDYGVSVSATNIKELSF